MSVRDALKLGSIIPSLARASTGSLVELFNLRQELEYETISESVLEEVLHEARLLLEANPEHLPIVENILDCTKIRLQMNPKRCLAMATNDQTESS